MPMRDAARTDWQRWRITPAPRPPAADRRTLPAPLAHRLDRPAADGIRHDLVDRVRRAIAAGAYDGDDIWAAAEERLLAAVGGIS